MVQLLQSLDLSWQEARPICPEGSGKARAISSRP